MRCPNPATRGNNNRDNVKQVLIESPTQSGTYTIRVQYDQKFINGEQYYSLLISGQAQPAVYDIDADGAIDLGDLAALVGAWLTDTPAADIYPALGDNWIDLLDFALLSSVWLQP